MTETLASDRLPDGTRRALWTAAAVCALVLGAGLVTAPATAAAPRAAGAAETVQVKKNVEIPTRSGHVLRADLYQPSVGGVARRGLPTIVTYFPYIKDDDRRFEVAAMTQFAKAGYAGLLVDIPGTGASIGEFGFFSDREIADGRDAIEWAGAQPFSNGRVGLWGYSYPGITAARIAATRPPHLKAVVPAAIFNDAYRDVVAPGGIRASQDAALIPFVAGQALARPRPGTDPAIAFEELLNTATSPGNALIVADAAAHNFYDDYWKERALDGEIEKIQVPALLWGGWSDVYPRGTLLNYAAIGSQYKRLVMGPWGHLAGVAGKPFELFMAESLRWYNTFLRQDPSPQQAKKVTGTRLFDINWSDTENVYAGVWPGRFVESPTGLPSAKPRTVALCSSGDNSPEPSAPWPIQGELTATCKTNGSLPVVHVPVDPTGGGSIAHDAYANPYANGIWDDKDQRLSLASTALLSAPLGRATTLTGPMKAELWASTIGTDTDWVVRVVDVGPDGTKVLAPGWLRAVRRSEDPKRKYLWHTHDHDEPIAAGEPYKMRIEVWPTSYTVPAGHRLGLLVRTADSLKVTPDTTPGHSSILTGPGRSSTLTYSERTTIQPSSGKAVRTAPGQGNPGADAGTTGRLPATGGTGPPWLMGATLLAAAGLLHRLGLRGNPARSSARSRRGRQPRSRLAPRP